MQKVKTYRCPAYLAWVRTLPCCHCQAPADDAHHIKGLKYGTVKPPDFATMPLCRGCHEMVGAAPLTWRTTQMRWVLNTQDRAFADGVLHD